ncbi:sulfurtransferase TusA family protein [Salipaludibacillus agaradhaerens]|uniref:Sulfurtransferase TusA family protein n=1 Tax=Salipaludibacillus agaradhaerens TaxID=76935 RepID=A0A9Q4B2D7_SALAG|nr:sulfurtransferase TusA family protein [Salipaludibacillus agaradhaerens]UJW57187.1 sulfurtransferase TusA family protein [Bacillus sp. A116_S68]MCR6097148.1 sulfurtransferase TusA family protein [Salipaludibacillus agaradhaerens]MCR6106016.1 sulfurtransferase TusA family protein [Salipaludibacillus agaradhaerens]MCR6113367.1 sulfurtransferase TusA family protein [Salipaludibacillus agaradhaerens]MCR6118049.1 sulfurtransferase TusA family protein [Salipaludibacillus agaradhaerens]
MSITADKLLDATGLACPMPIVKTKKEIENMTSGQIIEIHATDKGAKNDFAAWVKASGHKILADEDDNGLLKFWIEKA